MFKRYASTTQIMEKLALAEGKKLFSGSDRPISLEYEPENFVYFRCRAITANETNGNGDYFPADHLEPATASFPGVGLYKDHDSDSIDKAIGKVIWAEYIVPKEGNPYIETVCAVDRQLAPDLARRVESGIATSVSMGCSVREAECGVPGCGNIARNAQELCQHMMPGFGIKGRKGNDGEMAYEINRGIQFTELSLVTVPADPTARIFEVYAELHGKKALMSRADFIKELVRIAESASADDLSQFKIFLEKKGCTFENTLGAKAEFAKVVERKEELEQIMGLSISYIKGSSLAKSFFVASDSKSNYRVAASEVLPIIVQSSIESGETSVITPQRLIADLTQKYSSVGDFKAWAKRRRKKNRTAIKSDKSGEAKESGFNETKEPDASSVETAHPVKTEEAARPRVDEVSTAKASASDTGRSEMDKKATVELKKKASEVAAPVAVAAKPNAVEAPAQPEAIKPEDEKGEIFAAFELLRKYVESKLVGTKREAVKTESHANKGHIDEAGADKSVAAPAAIQEVSKTENPKGGMDKGAALKAEAMNKDWSINPKELEKTPKQAKPKDNMPEVMSVDRSELASEDLGADTGGKAGAQVKKFYGRLPSSGPGEATRAIDLKSAKDPEKDMLRKALAEEKAKTEASAKKEHMQNIADKVFEVVTAMKAKHLLANDKEFAVIDTLTARFADLGQLENLKTLVAHLAISRSAASEPELEASEVPVGSVVPQVFETVENTEDAVLKMASIWNR